ncbi:MAG TPA: cyclic nucleotide-binding domain-containing protein, partial [Stellaceae bacterium]|nr:cyclic nucleotide-binding domain-containing protein [Stellaceae bacterium]
MSLAMALHQTTRSAAPISASRTHACETCVARSLSICSAMRTEDLGHLAVVRISQQVAAGETFLNEGDPASHFLNIVEGSVKVYKLMPDRR